uniref:hypothetical protein n=1 Tax=Armatimonas sp. TaxID=1872638 RepID=UPI00286A745B
MKRRTFLMFSGGAAMLWGAGTRPQTTQPKNSPSFRRYPIPTAPVKMARDPRIPFNFPQPVNFPRPAPIRYALQSESRGIQLYSTELDRVRCVYFLEGIEWVGGLAGLKRVDRKRNEVQVYGTEDGLPEGSVLQVVADGAEVYAVVVRPRDGLLSFCALDTKTDKWVVLTQRPRQNPAYGVNQGGSLAISSDWVAFVPEVTLLTEEQRAPFYLYNRRTRKLQTAAWDPVIAADHRQLETQSILIHDTTLWLGTQLGLLGVALKTVIEPVRWRRLLPDRQIQSIAMLEEGKAAVLSTARGQDERESRRQRVQGNVELQGVELATGKTLTLPDIPPLTAKVPSFLLREGKALWLLSAEQPGQASPGFGQRSLPLALRLAPKATQWKTVPTGHVMRPPNAPPNFPAMGPLEVAEASVLPDLVAGVLVCLLGQQEPWLEQRFWRWRSPEAVLPAALAQPSQAYGSAEQVDPSDPNLLWLTEGDAFISVPRSERPAWEPLSMSFINGRPAMRRAPLTSPQAKRFPVDMAQAREGIRAGKLLSGSSVIALPDGNRLRNALLL